jgi:hypothetical protein
VSKDRASAIERLCIREKHPAGAEQAAEKLIGAAISIAL